MFVHFLLSQQEGASHVFDQATVTFVFLCLAVDVPPTPTALLTVGEDEQLWRAEGSGRRKWCHHRAFNGADAIMRLASGSAYGH